MGSVDLFISLRGTTTTLSPPRWAFIDAESVVCWESRRSNAWWPHPTGGQRAAHLQLPHARAALLHAAVSFDANHAQGSDAPEANRSLLCGTVWCRADSCCIHHGAGHDDGRSMTSTARARIRCCHCALSRPSCSEGIQ